MPVLCNTSTLLHYMATYSEPLESTYFDGSVYKNSFQCSSSHAKVPQVVSSWGLPTKTYAFNRVPTSTVTPSMGTDTTWGSLIQLAITDRVSYPQHIIEQLISWHGLHSLLQCINNYFAPRAVIYVRGLLRWSRFDRPCSYLEKVNLT
jgi:hypothetical protein